MFYHRRRDDLDQLLRFRRNVFVRAESGLYVLVSATQYLIVVHTFSDDFRCDPLTTERLAIQDAPEGLFDGQGWSLGALEILLALSTPIKHSR